MQITESQKDEYFKQWRHSLRRSQYRVEREFDSLPRELKDIIIALADLETEDLIKDYAKGYKLRDYTEKGQYKIAKAVKKCRDISDHFSRGITAKDFTLIDGEIQHGTKQNHRTSTA